MLSNMEIIHIDNLTKTNKTFSSVKNIHISYSFSAQISFYLKWTTIIFIYE